MSFIYPLWAQVLLYVVVCLYVFYLYYIQIMQTANFLLCKHLGSAGARELEAPSPRSPREASAAPSPSLIVVLSRCPQYNWEDPCLIFKRK